MGTPGELVKGSKEGRKGRQNGGLAGVRPILRVCS